MRELELLAPARNADIGFAAIDCGADAVYMAGPEFGARKDAGNPMEEVRRLCEYAHLFGARVFLTLNTILFDDEITAARNYFSEAADAGVDAVIAQDLAVFALGAQIQGPAIHASTQCAIRTQEQAVFYESLGASRLILERQLSLDQVKEIRAAVGCELEFFVHGALCVCYSGQCYMSEAIEGRSANRGACIQACRSLYDLVDKDGKILVKDKALLSLKDYNLIGRLGELADAGIASFKIEGRLKNITYVRNVVKAYSAALDALVAKHPGRYRRASFGKSEGGFVPDLEKTFNRGYTELFLDGERGSWSSMDAPKSIGEPVGTVEKVFTGGAQATMQVTVRMNDPKLLLHNGDGFSFVSGDHNAIVGFRGDICRGPVITTRQVPELYMGARLYRNHDASFERETVTNLPVRRIPVEVEMRIRGNSIAVKAASQDGRTVDLEAEAGGETAENTDRMTALFKAQVGKATGRYSFTLVRLETEDPEGRLPLMAASAINGIRREIASRLDSMPCGRIQLPGPSTSAAAPTGSATAVTGLGKVSYKANVSNRIARSILERLGAGTIEDAFEITHRKEAELMRTKYCIRHELGLCLKHPAVRTAPGGASSGNGPLYLVNNGRRYRLGFDCGACEMTVSSA